jgi:hypothetical protein
MARSPAQESGPRVRQRRRPAAAGPGRAPFLLAALAVARAAAQGAPPDRGAARPLVAARSTPDIGRPASPPPPQRCRVIVETDAGGDPDDEQSLVRFLLYCSEWDVEGILANRPVARGGENRSPARTGLGIVRRFVDAYAACFPKLRRHDPRFPPPEQLRQRTVAGYEETQDGVQLVIAAVDRPDPRPVWFLNWGTDRGAASSSLKRALDRVLRERGPEGYARFKDRLRLSSWDAFGEHTTTRSPPWRLWVDTFRPERDGQRWYRQFSRLTATAGGFDRQRDLLAGHGPLGALYPTNTTQPMKEGDTMTFLYLAPTGMNDPEQPTWGSWAGRYGLNEGFPGRPYYWANQADTWEGAASRDNTLRRWAAPLQNDFRARLEWCVRDPAHANHPPRPRVQGPLRRRVRGGEPVFLDASGSTDPDGQSLRFEWQFYPEPGTVRGPLPALRNARAAQASFVAPRVATDQTLHVLLTVTDRGDPPLTRYQRVIVVVAAAVRAGAIDGRHREGPGGMPPPVERRIPPG